MQLRKINSLLLAFFFVAFATETFAVEWNVSLWGKRRAFTEHIEKLAELVADRSAGEFTLKLSYGGLSKPRENLDGISAGTFEMAQFCAGYHPDKNPTITVLELPFLGVSDLEEERKISQALYQHPAAIADLAHWNATLLMPSPQPPNNLLGVGVPPRTLADYDGLTVRAAGGIGAALAAVGALPIVLTAPEVAQALDSGAIKAVAFAPHAHMSYGTVEKGKWWTTNLNLGTVNCPVVVNNDALAALSDNHRDTLLGAVDEALNHYIKNYNVNTMGRWEPILDEKGIQRITYSEDELDAFRSAVAGPAAEAWIADKALSGLPAQEIYDFVTGMIGK